MSSGSDAFSRDQLEEISLNTDEELNETEVATFKNCLTHENPEIREQAALGLGESVKTHPEIVRPTISELIDLLTDNDDWIRGRAAVALGKIDTEFPEAVAEAIPEIVALLSEERHVAQSITQANAAYAIELLTANHAKKLESAVEPLANLCTGHRPPVTYNAVAALHALSRSDPDLVKPVLDTIAMRVADDRSKIRTCAINTLAVVAHTDCESVVEAIEAKSVFVEFADNFDVLSTEETESLEGGLRILRKLAEKYPASIAPAINDIIQCLSIDATFDTAQEILFTIADHNPDTLTPLTQITPLLAADDPAIRRTGTGVLKTAASNGLTEVRDVVPELCERIDDGDEEVRQNVLVTLRELPTETYTEYKSSIPEFIDIITDSAEERWTRECASAICHDLGTDHPDWFESHLKSLLKFLSEDISPLGDVIGATVTAYVLIPLTEEYPVMFDGFVSTVGYYYDEASTSLEDWTHEDINSEMMKQSLLFLDILARLAHSDGAISIDHDFETSLDLVATALDVESAKWHLQASEWEERMRIHTVHLANHLIDLVDDPSPLVEPLLSIVQRNDGYVEEYCVACEALGRITPPPETAVEPLESLYEYRSEERVMDRASWAIEQIRTQADSSSQG